ncbi:uncharacterized protein LOC143228241 [Tachypleus tridentatus]|uniref:uncharacterized protein LOC143228241 n=1 Tax=Tachypleus tridentatus TaxID=6853 RepID=UPI003FD5F0C1
MFLFQVMKVIILVLVVSFVSHRGRAGTMCPPEKDIYPWFCINTRTSNQYTFTTVICNRHKCERHLENIDGKAGHMMYDRVIISSVIKENKMKDRSVVSLPHNWLWTSRVRGLEIRGTPLSGCFLCDSPVNEQEHYLNKLVVSNCFLNGTVCTNCKSSKRRKMDIVDTSGLSRLSSLETLDFSFNNLERITVTSFPSDLVSLKVMILSHNVISDVSS